eukprot:TRINITY_DN47848_c0_g1_i1.p1 TRINITY_DN47848_c0_g1~~TRINITY_DN47848_c0_g1_i1.p1  ORF type:complete len:386 (+),score=68.04 TRINITY_DN47848_c0_g1_i1:78-1235(+)
MPRNPYLVLGIKADAEEEDIRRAYRNRALQWHPDKRPPQDREAAEQLFKDLGQAYEILRDPEKRKAFDAVQRRTESCQRGASQGGLAAMRKRFRRPARHAYYAGDSSTTSGTPRATSTRSGTHRSTCDSSFETADEGSDRGDVSGARAPPGRAGGGGAETSNEQSRAPFEAYGCRVWFARGSACVGRAYKGQEAEELAAGRQTSLLAAAAWICSSLEGTCLLEVRGCSQKGEIPLRQQESLAKARCQKAVSFLTGQAGLPEESLRIAPAQLRDNFQGVELTGMRRIDVNGEFLNDESLLLSDENTLAAITRFLLTQPSQEKNKLFFEVLYSKDSHRLAQRRKAALLAALSSSGRLRSQVAGGVRLADVNRVFFYTYEQLPDVDFS